MTKLSETLPIEEARERLRQLISELAVVRGKVTLASGKEADYYVDLRRITLHHEASRLVGQVMLDLLDRNGIEFEAAGGLTMGADPRWFRNYARGGRSGSCYRFVCGA